MGRTCGRLAIKAIGAIAIVQVFGVAGQSRQKFAPNT
jgi:hypothetical protein